MLDTELLRYSVGSKVLAFLKAHQVNRAAKVRFVAYEFLMKSVLHLQPQILSTLSSVLSLLRYYSKSVSTSLFNARQSNYVIVEYVVCYILTVYFPICLVIYRTNCVPTRSRVPLR